MLFGHLAELSGHLARVHTFFLDLAFPKMLPTEHFVRRLPAYPRLRQPLIVSEGHSRHLVIGLVGVGVGLLIRADLLLLIVACKIL